jgi:DNA repair exonuclease SbcCD ATPase subunit
MRDEYKDEPGGFSPVKFGLIGALVIAAAVGCLLWVQSQNRTIEALQNQQAATFDELEKTKKEREDLQARFDELKQTSLATSTQYKKQLQQRESQLSTVKREKEQESEVAERKLDALSKEKASAEAQIAQMKKDVEVKSQALKQLQDQIGKGQADLQKVRSEYDRAQKLYSELQRKIKVIDDGDQAAADVMVQQLAETRRQLKEEQEMRRKLEQQLAAQQNPQ